MEAAPDAARLGRFGRTSEGHQARSERTPVGGCLEAVVRADYQRPGFPHAGPQRATISIESARSYLVRASPGRADKEKPAAACDPSPEVPVCDARLLAPPIANTSARLRWRACLWR